jgi:hypothetical protein
MSVQERYLNESFEKLSQYDRFSKTAGGKTGCCGRELVRGCILFIGKKNEKYKLDTSLA